jgi:hypothetical protein
MVASPLRSRTEVAGLLAKEKVGYKTPLEAA